MTVAIRSDELNALKCPPWGSMAATSMWTLKCRVRVESQAAPNTTGSPTPHQGSRNRFSTGSHGRSPSPRGSGDTTTSGFTRPLATCRQSSGNRTTVNSKLHNCVVRQAGEGKTSGSANHELDKSTSRFALIIASLWTSWIRSDLRKAELVRVSKNWMTKAVGLFAAL
jgi:hypothetical protein